MTVRGPPSPLQKTVLEDVITVQMGAPRGCSRPDRDANATVQRVTRLLLTFWSNCSVFPSTLCRVLGLERQPLTQT